MIKNQSQIENIIKKFNRELETSQFYDDLKNTLVQNKSNTIDYDNNADDGDLCSVNAFSDIVSKQN